MTLRSFFRCLALVGGCTPLAAQCVSLGTFASQGSVPTGLPPSGTASEISGIVASRHNPGVLWVHDDSGNAAQLIALRSNGALARQYPLSGVVNRDWEDLALGPGPIAGRDYLYIADIGNNALGYTSFTLLRVPEPDVPAGTGAPIVLPPPEVFPFQYPSGAWNAETLWIDPVDGTPYVLTKVSLSTCHVFRYPMPLDASVTKSLVLAATLTNMPVTFTGGAISADGRWIFARTYAWIHAWHRPAGTSFASAFASAPCVVANVQGQAEAIAVAADGSGLWAVSEGAGAVVRKAPIGWPAGAPVSYAFGSGLAGGVGVPGLGATAVARLGGPGFDFGSWQLPANGVGLFVLSLTGLDDGALPWSGGWLHAFPDIIAPAPFSAQGALVLPFPGFPDEAWLYGLSLFAQLVTVDAAAVQGYGMSAGLRIVFDR